MRTMQETADVTTAGRAEPLLAHYRGVICDLDGVVYRGSAAVPGSVETLNRVMQDGVPVVFATNNASRPPAAAGAHLRDLGLGRHEWSVVTSSQAAAAYLAEQLDPDSPVLAVGGPGVAHALAEAGLAPMRVSDLRDRSVAAVVQGAGQDVTWRDLAEVGYLAQRGVTWVATNLDPTVPTSRGQAPGNGAFVAAVQATTSAIPHVTGKPGAALFDLARARLGTDQADTIVCGDRLETDIAGAKASGLDSMLVMSGACRLQHLAFAPPAFRPTYVAIDLTGLLEPGLRPVAAEDDRVELTPGGVPQVRDGDRGQLLKSLLGAVWAARDGGHAVSDDHELWRRLELRLGLTPEDPLDRAAAAQG